MSAAGSSPQLCTPPPQEVKAMGPGSTARHRHTHRPTPPVHNAARGRTKDKGRKWGRGEEMEERSATFCATLWEMPRASLCPEPLFPRRCSGTTRPQQAPRAAGGAPRPAALPSPASRGSQRLPVRPEPSGPAPAGPQPSPPPHRTPHAAPRCLSRAGSSPRRGLRGSASARQPPPGEGGERPPRPRLALPGRPSRPRTMRGGAGPGASFPRPFPPRGAGHLHGCGSPGRR